MKAKIKTLDPLKCKLVISTEEVVYRLDPGKGFCRMEVTGGVRYFRPVDIERLSKGKRINKMGFFFHLKIIHKKKVVDHARH